MDTTEDLDRFGWLNKFPEFELIRKFLKEHDVKDELIDLFEKKYDLISQSQSIKNKLLGRNIVSPLLAAIQAKALPIFIDSLIKIAQEDKEWGRLSVF